jgi:CheY-like chemotaxis protein
VLEERRFDAILMDCQMPEVDGFTATRALRRQEAANGRRRTPVIAVTANAMAGDRERCLEAGMDDYLAKPFSRDQLLAMLVRWTQNGMTEGAESASPGLALGPLDASALQTLRELQRPDRPNLLVRVIDIFNRDAPRLAAEIRVAAGAGDTETLRQAAHALKSASANVGAIALGERCREIEEYARTADAGAVSAPVGGIDEELGRVIAALAQERTAA